ncbi:hypothetical protein [Alicyclobacillus acidocaldarius]|uniref:Uncharacterized protein n=1 Tax=Alicyclobacillus acidocaldarius (strain Tc-4-1) TaxID=1048834 RepID=F8IL31_ALIAT|nr:hypothetical protein [Alicyclobacillus acidocaldarius]AEJ42412.1 hypothetical protein TC41_0446 [Alicyclobacillus acidocaldarius subsp. acidocaldarius Tc-4-1]
MNVRRATLLRQLDQPEFADLRPTLLGELKAVESVRDEFVAMFDLWPDTEDRPDPRTPNAPTSALGETTSTKQGAETEPKAEETGESGQSRSAREEQGGNPEENDL